jgi:hypothetical protein
MATEIPRLRPQTVRYRQSLARLEAFVRDVGSNTDADVFTLAQDAFDAHLAAIDMETDIPAVAVRVRYVSDVTGSLVEPRDGETYEDVARELIGLIEEVRVLVDSQTEEHEERDRVAYYEADPRNRVRVAVGSR